MFAALKGDLLMGNKFSLAVCAYGHLRQLQWLLDLCQKNGLAVDWVHAAKAAKGGHLDVLTFLADVRLLSHILLGDYLVRSIRFSRSAELTSIVPLLRRQLTNSRERCLSS